MRATAVRQEQITEVQSLNMIRNAVRTAVSTIAYLRNLFEEDAFEDKNVSGLPLKLLKPCNAEAELLTNWLEKGVFDALEKQYLKLLVFGIHGENDELIECYQFKFSFNGASTGIDVTRMSGGLETNKSVACTKEDAKIQTVELLSSLIHLTQSLSPLPQSRHMSMKLWYHDNLVPSDYEPELFRSALPEEALRFDEIPLEVSLGSVDTGHHGLLINIKSTADQEIQLDTQDELPAGGHSQIERALRGDLEMSQIPMSQIPMSQIPESDAGLILEVVSSFPRGGLPSEIQKVLPHMDTQALKEHLDQLVVSGELECDRRRYRVRAQVPTMVSNPRRTTAPEDKVALVYSEACKYVATQAVVRKDLLATHTNVGEKVATEVIKKMQREKILEKYDVKRRGFPVTSVPRKRSSTMVEDAEGPSSYTGHAELTNKRRR